MARKKKIDPEKDRKEQEEAITYYKDKNFAEFLNIPEEERSELKCRTQEN